MVKSKWLQVCLRDSHKKLMIKGEGGRTGRNSQRLNVDEIATNVACVNN
jgi:hypothetical protein